LGHCRPGLAARTAALRRKPLEISMNLDSDRREELAAERL
jgi:hypothetical protein